MFLTYSAIALQCSDSVLCSSFWILQEHFYDEASGIGYLAWWIKTVQRNTAVQSQRGSTSATYQDGPRSKRDFLVNDKQLIGEECHEAISLLMHSTDAALVKRGLSITVNALLCGLLQLGKYFNFDYKLICIVIFSFYGI